MEHCRNLNTKAIQVLPLIAIAVATNLFAEGEPKMPMLNWMGRKTVTNAVNDVAVKILREDKALGYCCQCENVASLNKTLAAHPHFHATNP